MKGKSPTEARKRMLASLGQEEASAREVGRKRGEPERRPKVGRKSEGRIRAKRPGNGWHPEPAEQRRPVLARTFWGET